MDDFERQKADAYAGARNDTIAAGGDEQSRLFADALSGRGQQFGERQSNAAFGNQAAEQDFGQRFQSGQFQNAIRSQRFGEELTQRNQPFAEFMQLVHGNSPNMPNMSNTAQIQGMQAPDYMSAVGMNQAGAQNAYNQQMGARNNMFSTVGRVASSFAGK